MAWLMPVINTHSLVIKFFCSNIVKLVEKSIFYYKTEDHIMSATFNNLKYFKYVLVPWYRFMTPIMDVKALKVAKKCI